MLPQKRRHEIWLGLLWIEAEGEKKNEKCIGVNALWKFDCHRQDPLYQRYVLFPLYRTVTPTCYIITVILNRVAFISVSSSNKFAFIVVAIFPPPTGSERSEDLASQVLLTATRFLRPTRLPWSPGDPDPIFSCWFLDHEMPDLLPLF